MVLVAVVSLIGLVGVLELICCFEDLGGTFSKVELSHNDHFTASLFVP